MSKILKSFYLNGERSADHGLFISGDAVYNAPAYDYEVIQIPGRNGDLVMDNGRFNNITVTYPAFVTDVANLQDIRQWLLKNRGYQRIEDEYNPTEFRMGYFSGDFDVNVFANRAGSFDLTFNCKPQRFLTQGEREHDYQLMTLDSVNQEYVRSYTVVTEAELFDDEWAVGGDPDDWLPALKEVVGSAATKTRAQLITYLNSNTGGLDLKTAGCIAGDGTQESVQIVIDHSGYYSGYYRSMFHIIAKNGQDQTVDYSRQGTHIKIYNPTRFVAKPLYATWGLAPSGTDPKVIVTSTVPGPAYGEIYIDVSQGTQIVIDTDTWEAYSESGGVKYSKNDKISMPYSTNMPALPPGLNYLSAYMLSNDPTDQALFWITPRWWII